MAATALVCSAIVACSSQAGLPGNAAGGAGGGTRGQAVPPEAGNQNGGGIGANPSVIAGSGGRMLDAGLAGGGSSAGSTGSAGSPEPRVTLPNPIDPAAMHPDFALQGEYVGEVITAAGPKRLGAQVVCVAPAEFRLVFEAGGLPGDGWDGTNKIDVDGKRIGTVVTFAPSVSTRAVATGGVRGQYQGSIEAGELRGTDDLGQPFTLARVLRESPTRAMKPPPGALVLFDGTHNDEL